MKVFLEEGVLLKRWIFLLAFVGAASMPNAQGAQDAGEPKTSILVAYDTRTGHTERIARAIVEGIVLVEDAQGILRAQDDVSDEEIAAAAGILVGTPVHWGNLSANTKAFLDRIATLLVARKELGPDAAPHHRSAGAFVTGGSVSSGKELARIAILTAFVNMRFVLVGAVDADGFGTLGAQATTGEADPGVSEKELEEARSFGKRFAEVTMRLAR